MNIKQLYLKLKEAYTLKNLNNISLTLINLYKEEQCSILQKIAEIIENFIIIEITNKGKGFSKLIKLYHPDRLNHYLSEIERLYQEDRYDELLDYSHILKLERIEQIAESLNSYEDIDYSPVYEWDFNEDGFSIINDEDKFRKTHTKSTGYNFYDAIKIRQYGHTEIDFPSYYLEDIEDFELASSDINDLEGIQFCLHAKNIDLSENRISDISLLEGLEYIEDLNLSDNHISEVSTLSNLMNLKKLYLSNNQITDISPIYELGKLEYVELSGNDINDKQIDDLNGLGIIVEI